MHTGHLGQSTRVPHSPHTCSDMSFLQFQAMVTSAPTKMTSTNSQGKEFQ